MTFTSPPFSLFDAHWWLTILIIPHHKDHLSFSTPKKVSRKWTRAYPFLLNETVSICFSLILNYLGKNIVSFGKVNRPVASVDRARKKGPWVFVCYLFHGGLREYSFTTRHCPCAYFVTSSYGRTISSLLAVIIINTSCLPLLFSVCLPLSLYQRPRTIFWFGIIYVFFFAYLQSSNQTYSVLYLYATLSFNSHSSLGLVVLINEIPLVARPHRTQLVDKTVLTSSKFYTKLVWIQAITSLARRLKTTQQKSRILDIHQPSPVFLDENRQSLTVTLWSPPVGHLPTRNSHPCNHLRLRRPHHNSIVNRFHHPHRSLHKILHRNHHLCSVVQDRVNRIQLSKDHHNQHNPWINAYFLHDAHLRHLLNSALVWTSRTCPPITIYVKSMLKKRHLLK